MPGKKQRPEEPKVVIDRVDHARLVSENGVTFYAKFCKLRKTCAVSIGRDVPPDHNDAFVVSYNSLRAFAGLIQKYTGKGA